jgi:hypothetical protein
MIDDLDEDEHTVLICYKRMHIPLPIYFRHIFSGQRHDLQADKIVVRQGHPGDRLLSKASWPSLAKAPISAMGTTTVHKDNPPPTTSKPKALRRPKW